MQIEQATRIFKLGSLSLPDPDPSLSPEEAVKLYAPTYPQVAAATLSGPEIGPDGQVIYEVQRAPAKTKG
ncbi:MAG: hypothetical protein D6720_13185 [Gammaproteobacteria bacterium]|nr:MAG: hypothetical protein D6720_13185 [Gammaproteobacteria bacterium]